MKDEIQILSEIEAVRQNPWMYIGSVGNDGAHHLLNELVLNSVDEAQLGFCKKISVRLQDQECIVEDDGRGIPTEMHSEAGIPASEVALTRLHAGSKFEREANIYTAGLHGVGLSCVNALSSELVATIKRGGYEQVQHFTQGKAVSPLTKKGKTELHGTSIAFTPDQEIFKDFSGFDPKRCKDLLENLAHLNPGVEFHFKSNDSEGNFLFQEKSLKGLLKKISAEKRILFAEAIEVSGDSDGLVFQASFTWSAESAPTLLSFVNCVETIHGGTHLNALRAGIAKAVNRMMAEIGKSSWRGSPAEIEEVCEGIVGVLNCKVTRPNFEGQTKSRFTKLEISEAVEKITADKTFQFLNSHPKISALIFERISDARNARMAAKRVADRVYLQHGRKEIDEEIYKEQFGARSKNWHDSAVWITHGELLKSHADLCKVSEDSIALDVCCGSGVVGASFKGKVKKVIGLDLTPEMVKLASERLDEVHQGNVYNIPFPDNTFDLVCTREVLHLLPYPERPVSEIFRVLKPGGQFVVGQILPFSEDDAPWMYRVFKKKQPLIFNMFQEEDFRRLLLSPGFVDLEMTEMNVWESIDVWINSYETTAIHRHEIRELFRTAPAEAKAIHPFKISASGEIQDLWRWCVFSVRKPK